MKIKEVVAAFLKGFQYKKSHEQKSYARLALEYTTGYQDCEKGLYDLAIDLEKKLNSVENIQQFKSLIVTAIVESIKLKYLAAEKKNIGDERFFNIKGEFTLHIMASLTKVMDLLPVNYDHACLKMLNKRFCALPLVFSVYNMKYEAMSGRAFEEISLFLQEGEFGESLNQYFYFHSIGGSSPFSQTSMYRAEEYQQENQYGDLETKYKAVPKLDEFKEPIKSKQDEIAEQAYLASLLCKKYEFFSNHDVRKLVLSYVTESDAVEEQVQRGESLLVKK